MGRERPLVVGLALVMVLGFAVYFRLWAIDYSISSTETDILRFCSSSPKLFTCFCRLKLLILIMHRFELKTRKLIIRQFLG